MIKIYNSLSKQVEEFVPLTDGPIQSCSICRRVVDIDYFIDKLKSGNIPARISL